jgi:hypothetical protein
MKRVTLCCLLTFALSGCVGASGSTLDTPNPTAAGVLAPIDPSITPVSRSQPSTDAKAAMTACGVFDNTIGMAKVSGMGQIAHASDAIKYAPFVGTEPILQVSAPAYLIQFRGAIPIPLGHETATDPVCVYVDGEPQLYLTGGYAPDNGPIVTPLPAHGSPVFALPPLAP